MSAHAFAGRPERPSPGLPAADDYVAFCVGVHKLCGVDLGQYKRGQMERRIRTFSTERGHATLPAYLRVLAGDPAEVDAFLDRVTINVSQLWRNPEQWTALGEQVLPALAREGRIRAWSAGCSYGAEAYTLAAICRQVAPRAFLDILGTDIDKRMVARAREGRFSAEDARTAPQEALSQEFARTPEGWQASPALRAIVRFEVGDLLRMRVQKERFDLVLCRNTVIYFTPDVRDALHARLVESLRPGGHLMIGATERVNGSAELGLETVGPFLYRRI
jgi:chemotaxis protein methyltransferase CheR